MIFKRTLFCVCMELGVIEIHPCGFDNKLFQFSLYFRLTLARVSTHAQSCAANRGTQDSGTASSNRSDRKDGLLACRRDGHAFHLQCRSDPERVGDPEKLLILNTFYLLLNFYHG